MRLGQQVLSKIENLLTHFEESPPTQQKEDFASHSPVKKQRQKSYVKLYEHHKVQLKKHQNNQKNKMIEEIKENIPFKITNRHTMFLNSQNKQYIPLYKRLDTMNTQKQKEIQRLRQKHTLQKDRDNLNELRQQQLAVQMEERRRNERKFTKQQANRKHQQLMDRQRMRVQRLNMTRIKTMQNQTKQFKRKPYVRKQTDDMWSRYKLRKQLSSSVFDRFEQYQMERKSHLQQVQKEIKKQLTPFAPKISQQSRLLASRSTSINNLHQSLSKSSSCKCFQKSRVRKNNNNIATMHSTRQLNR